MPKALDDPSSDPYGVRAEGRISLSRPKVQAAPETSMSEPVELSVILPNYNHARCLSRAIEAIAGQSRPPDEIIVIDDASQDNSLEILALARRQHPNLI